MSILADFLMPVTDLKLLGLVAVGTFAGIYVGAIPGLSVTMAVSILISFTFSWDVYPALALMIGAASAKAQDGPEAPFVDMSVMTGTPLNSSAMGTMTSAAPVNEAEAVTVESTFLNRRA